MTDGVRSLDEAEVAGKRILLRADLNVPMSGGSIADATRIENFAPTVRNLLGRGASVVVMTHLGRPKGQAVPHLSVAPLIPALAEATGRNVTFVGDCVGAAAEAATARLSPGEVVLLENLRFHNGEELNDPEFARALAVHGDLYVNDAFSCSHRAHASLHAITRLLPTFAGHSMMRELTTLTQALETPERPIAALVGGAKVSSKIAVLDRLAGLVDVLIVGGGMANTFLFALDTRVGRSLVEPDLGAVARAILATAKKTGCNVVLPTDVIVADRFEATATGSIHSVDSVPDDAMILDVGPRSVADIFARLSGCRTLLWNGPLGAFEMPQFSRGTFEVAQAAADLTKAGELVTIAGGGDTVAALKAAGSAEDFTHLSTAGGAFLEWLEGRELPGVGALRSGIHQAEEA